jgi:hypothetical protein
MKALKFIGHPVLLICMFLLLIIEGENFGGLYLMYLLLALPHGMPYALAAAVGIGMILIAFNLKNLGTRVASPWLYMTGFLLMHASLFLFFREGNQFATFHLLVPSITFVLFGIISISFLLNIALKYFRKPQRTMFIP